MDAGLIDRIERGAARAASVLFAGAAGFAVYRWLAANLPQLALGACTGGAAALAYLLCGHTLKAVGGGTPRFAVPAFDVREIETLEAENELLLTDVYRLEAVDASHPDEPLVLDDILAEIGPDARVVRLFDRKAMPTPGQLKSRIDSHLCEEPMSASPPDASQALSDALAELKRSLR